VGIVSAPHTAWNDSHSAQFRVAILLNDMSSSSFSYLSGSIALISLRTNIPISTGDDPRGVRKN
jgi:hypothetical protein